jgi:hypothetical protein
MSSGISLPEIEKEEVFIVATSNTGGLASILQLTDNTPNEVFAVKHSTSGTEFILIVADLETEEEQEVEEEDS